MKQALAALFGAAFTVAACYAVGAVLLEKLRVRPLRRGEQIPLAFVLGAACLHLLIFGLFAAHLAYGPVLIAALAIAVVAYAVRAWTGNGPPPLQAGLDTAPSPARKGGGYTGRIHPGLVFLVSTAAFVVLYIANAWA